MDTVLANYVDRECAPLEEIYKSMYAAEGNLCFLGPKWAGKTTTLIAVLFGQGNAVQVYGFGRESLL